jgi:hypothetical protein
MTATHFIVMGSQAAPVPHGVAPPHAAPIAAGWAHLVALQTSPDAQSDDPKQEAPAAPGVAHVSMLPVLMQTRPGLQSSVWKLHGAPAALFWTVWQVWAVGSHALPGAHTFEAAPHGIPLAIDVAQVPQTRDVVVPPSLDGAAPTSQRELAHCTSLRQDWPGAREPGAVLHAAGCCAPQVEEAALTHAWRYESVRLEPGSASTAAQY